MSVKLSNRVWEHSEQNSNDLVVMLKLADWGNDMGVSWYSQDVLAERTRVCRKTINTVCQRLEEAGELRIYPRAGRSHHYMVTVGMTREQLLQAVNWLADERGETLLQMERTRRGRVQNLHTPCNPILPTPCNPVVPKSEDDPSIPIKTSTPKGGADAPAGDDPKKTDEPKKSRPRDTLFDAWARVGHGIDPDMIPDDDRQWVGRGKSAMVRCAQKAGITLTPEVIALFGTWWSNEFKDATMPTDPQKIPGHFVKFLTWYKERQKQAQRPKPEEKPDLGHPLSQVEYARAIKMLEENRPFGKKKDPDDDPPEPGKANTDPNKAKDGEKEEKLAA